MTLACILLISQYDNMSPLSFAKYVDFGSPMFELTQVQESTVTPCDTQNSYVQLHSCHPMAFPFVFFVNLFIPVVKLSQFPAF